MSLSYKAVGWNSFKKKYDLMLAGILVLLLVVFVMVSMIKFPAMTFEIALIRGLGLTSILLLHFILAIGPMARIDRRWLPILYNRRHLGVTLFILALFHGLLSIMTYHAGSDVNPVVSVFTTDSGTTVGTFPFQAFGFLALMVLFVMAATSHDFWLANLTAPVWKWLHMGVYLAYLFLVLHISFGILQSETNPIYGFILASGLVLLSGLHILAAKRSRKLDRIQSEAKEEGDYQKVCKVSDLEENIPLATTIAGERVAVLLWEGNKVSAVSGVCQHQNGPLSEGKFIHGCLTCPWHGYQYLPSNGCSPEPFNEKIPTFRVKLEGEFVYVDKKPNPAGTAVEPAIVHNISN